MAAVAEPEEVKEAVYFDTAAPYTSVEAPAHPKFVAFSAEYVAKLREPREHSPHLAPFLLPSTLCDSDHPDVAALAKSIVPADASSRQAADAIRKWVRNEIKYVLHPLHLKASEVLARREGMCTNKSVLQVALCRAAGIAAALSIVHISKTVFKETADPELYARIHDPTVHVCALCYVAPENRFMFFDAVEEEPEEGKETVDVEDLPSGETRFKHEHLRGPFLYPQASLDHMLTARLRKALPKEALERTNEGYRGKP